MQNPTSDMGPIQIESGHLMLGQSLKDYCVRHIYRVVGKTAGGLVGCTVHFKEEGSMFECTIVMKVPQGELVGNSKGKDIYQSFNFALDKVSKQSRRSKREQRDDKPHRRPDKDANISGPTVHRWEPSDPA